MRERLVVRAASSYVIRVEREGEVVIARGGDTRAGFVVAAARAQRYVHTRAWGIFTLDMAYAYRDAMYAAFARTRSGTAPWGVLSDRRGMVAQPEDVQAVLFEILRHATELGRTHAAVVLDNAVAQLQMRRLASGTRLVQRVFAEETSAIAWLTTALARG